jgi:hypothetical protein
VPDLTPYQLAVLRACPDQPGARFPSSTKEVLALDALTALGLVRPIPFYRRNGDERVRDTCWQRTPAGKEVADG